MKPSLSFIAVSLLDGAAGLPSWLNKHHVRPAFFLLAGDMTTAIQSAGGGRWGAGFLNKTLRSPASGLNYGHDGATTVSFVASGDWADVLGQVDSHKASDEVFVTIQFGHNDQKPAANISLAEYSTNLGNLVDDVRSPGGTLILVTPLTRLAFNFSLHPPQVIENPLTSATPRSQSLSPETPAVST